MEENSLLTKLTTYFFVILYFIGFLVNVSSKNWLFAGIWGILFTVNIVLMILRKVRAKK